MAYYRDRCLNCHGEALLNSHPKPNQNCFGCHMPRLPVGRGAHTIFTDHRIAIYTPQELANLRSESIGNGSAPSTNEDELVSEAPSDGHFGAPTFRQPFAPPFSLFDHLGTVLAVKGSLRRAQ